jgi:predicted DNA-binding transcriptional regulator YafY
MPRASHSQRAQRLNLARSLLLRFKDADALRELAHRCSISPRQAYRYLQQARSLKQPVPITPAKIAFTVKLNPDLVSRLRRHAHGTHLNLSETVSRALARMLDARPRRG